MTIQTTKTISLRIPMLYFRRFGYLAYHTGRLPSEVAREILINYLDLGCAACGGPVHQWEVDMMGVIGLCANPACAEGFPGQNMTWVDDFSSLPEKLTLPGFAQ